MNTYILQKDLPDLKAGAEFTFYLNNGIANLYNCNRYDYNEDFIKSNPEWFKLKEEKLDDVLSKMEDWAKVIKLLSGLKEFTFKVFTEEDMRKCWNAARERKDLLSHELLNKSFKEYINSLNENNATN